MSLHASLSAVFFILFFYIQSKRQEDMQKGRVEDAIRRHKQVNNTFYSNILHCVSFRAWFIVFNCFSVFVNEIQKHLLSLLVTYIALSTQELT